MKRASDAARALVAQICVVGLFAATLLGGCGCRGRDEAAGPAAGALNHSKKSSSSSSSSSSLPFVSLSFDEALARAHAEKKLVFVDVTADWCSWCTKMDEDVFADDRVKAALLEFVPVKVDADTGGGRAVANRYRVGGLPAYLVLNADGALVGSFGGYMPVEPFLRSLRRASGSPG